MSVPSQSGEIEQLPAVQVEAAEEKAGVIIVEAWARYPWLCAGFSPRVGGSSVAYSGDGRGELNLGWTASEPPETVNANRRQFVRKIWGDGPVELVTVQQFHGDVVCMVGADDEPRSTPEGKAVLRGDALMTGVPGLLLGIQTADCVPVLVADTRLRVVAAFHAGWRGTQKRIVEHGIGRLRQQYGSRPEDMVAAIGPCIRACCFEVGEKVRSEFRGHFAYSDRLFSGVQSSDTTLGNPGTRKRMYLDLVEANQQQLCDAGIPGEQISIVGECTACTRLPDGRRKYFSHRAEQGHTGRMLSVIGVVPEPLHS